MNRNEMLWDLYKIKLGCVMREQALVEAVADVNYFFDNVKVHDESKQVDNTKVLVRDMIGMSNRAANALIGSRITTLGELVKVTELELERIPNMGQVSIDIIKQSLASHNMKLKGAKK